MMRGHAPYRDFAVEYPPLALPVFALPALLVGRHDFAAYAAAFEALMAVFGVACAVLVAAVLQRLDASPRRLAFGVALAALGPLAIGPVLLSRFDLWPAALTAGALAAIVFDRPRLGFALLGLGVATKLYPLVLVPLALVHVARRRGRREAAAGGAIAAAAALLPFVPFVALSPHGVWHSIQTQLGRPLQIESLGASALLIAHRLWGQPIVGAPSHGSDNLVGGAAHALALEQSVLQVVAILVVWIAYAHGPADAWRLLRFAAAAVCAFVALGKVLSPQYLGWLLPLVPLVRGRRGLAAGGLLVLAMALTQAWFPYRYLGLVYGFDPWTSLLVACRDATLLVLLAVLLWSRDTSRIAAG